MRPYEHLARALDAAARVIEERWCQDDTTPDQDRRLCTVAALLREAASELRAIFDPPPGTH